ncbi:MAG: thioredoxin [Chromatiaceae bacterium]|nr:MAG: thioredoxin [Chromatiaceae bacterium]
MAAPALTLPAALLLALCAAPSLASSIGIAPEATAQASPQTTPGRLLGVSTGGHPEWFKQSFLDLHEDVDEAAAAGRHVILFLEMNGCPYCYQMAVDAFDQAPYRDWLQAHFDVIALNLHGDREVALDATTSMSEKELATLLGVRYTPTVIFLDQNNNPVARVNGYRNAQDFKQILDYVATMAYGEQALADYLAAVRTARVYTPQPHPLIRSSAEVNDLSAVSDRPLALLLEDGACVACADLYRGHLADPEVQAALAPFVVVRLDSSSDDSIIAPDGHRTTPRQLAADLGITYRPALVLYDQGREIVRIESQLYRWHFTGILEYVGQGHYRRYPGSPFGYINAKTAARLAAGQDVSIVDEE